MLLVRVASCAAAIGGSALLAERLSLAFHEAGHSIVAVHFSESGVHTDGGRGHFVDAQPMLRFATIVPRVTDKGKRYLGETKLMVRWRDMRSHVRWIAKASPADFAPAPTPRLKCSAVNAAASPELETVLGLARIAYLFGGGIAEERLEAALPWASKLRSIPERVTHCINQQRTVIGDVRKAKQVAKLTLKLNASAPKGDCLPGLEAAFAFADGILAVRWPQCCALAGALIVRGSITGDRHLELMQTHSQALSSKRHTCDEGGEPSGSVHSGPLLDMLAPYPFLFGCVWAASRWPRPERIQR